MDQTTKLVDAGAVAELLHVTRQTVHHWRRSGLIPFLSIGGIIRFDIDAVLEALRQAAHAPQYLSAGGGPDGGRP